MNNPNQTNQLRDEIASAINRASAENPSGTPDHILADYLLGCLEAFDQAVLARATWRGESTTFTQADYLGNEED